MYTILLILLIFVFNKFINNCIYYQIVTLVKISNYMVLINSIEATNCVTKSGVFLFRYLEITTRKFLLLIFIYFNCICYQIVTMVKIKKLHTLVKIDL